MGTPLHILRLRWGLSWAESPPKAMWSLWPPWPAITLTLSHHFPLSLQPGLAPAFGQLSASPAHLRVRAGLVAARERVVSGHASLWTVRPWGRGCRCRHLSPKRGHSGVCVWRWGTAWPCHDPPSPPKTSQWPPGALSMPRAGRRPGKNGGLPLTPPRCSHSSCPSPYRPGGCDTPGWGSVWGSSSSTPPGGHYPPPSGLPGRPCVLGLSW